ncbi:outer membrane protein assembly factor BamB family protein [Pontibacter virosus]|uniref:Putative secreted protein (Por secretion system target) n=1 Tax=Pontibacter virosus TaxID=1765052 RepID=A0A2U1ARH2_9BACT|nr:PQQ-binding-like beta-propeller repeat protein [Pontibacter virosus]PVY39049.1 putative secreted protein (Por secretion system target) [Pontibacter virosus]
MAGIAVDKSGGVYMAATVNADYRLAKFNAATGALQWQQQFGGSAGLADGIADIKVDNRGGVYVTGSTLEKYKPFPDSDVTVNANAITTIKYNTQDGSQAWVAGRIVGGEPRQVGRRLELDETGVYVVGNSDDMIFLKYDPNTGQQHWVTTYRGGTRMSEGRDIALDGAGGVYVTGISEDGMSIISTLKLNALSGEIIWSDRYSSSGADYNQAGSIAVDGQGGVFIAGTSYFQGDKYNYIVVHYDGASGTRVWEKRLRDMQPYLKSMVLTSNDGGLYLTGSVYNEVGDQSRNMIVTRMNASTGDDAWSQRYGWNGPVSYTGTDVVVDEAGNTYVTGIISIEFGEKYVYAAKYAASGEMLWSTHYKDKREAYSKNFISLDKEGDVYVATSKGLLLKLQATNGALVWQSQVREDSELQVDINALVLDDSGNIYVAGAEHKPRVSFEMISSFLTIKFDAASGSRLWEKRYGGNSGYDHVKDLVLDGNGNLYVTGSVFGSDRTVQMATIKYNSANGEERWIAIHHEGYPAAIAADGTGGIYVTGTKSIVNNFATIKYNAEDGKEAWVSYFGTDGRRDVPEAIAVDNAGGVYVAGINQSDVNGMQISVLKYNSTDGSEIWAHRHEEWIQSESGTRLMLDNKGSVYLAGNIRRTFVLASHNTEDGEVIWTKESDNLLGLGSDFMMDFTLDAKNNLYLTGLNYQNATTRKAFTIKYSQDAPCAPAVQQAIAGPDKVRAGAKDVAYTLEGTKATSYTWSVDGPGPVRLSGQNTAQITTNWPASAGFYEVNASYGNNCGTHSATHKVAVYNPDDRIVAAAGWLHSPQNTQMDFMQQEGRGYFGVAVQYRNKTEQVQGQVAFQLKENDLNFKSTSFEAERLIVFGQEANFKGKGTINGKSGYGFLVAIVNHALNVKNPNDRLRLMIWEEESGRIVYDNQAGDAEEATATNRIGMGAMVLYDPKNPDLLAKAELEALGIQLPGAEVAAKLMAYPNAFSDRTTISFALEKDEAYTLEVYDMNGRLVRKVGEGTAKANQLYEYELEGQTMSDGMYIARLVTDSGTQSIKLLLRR